MSAAMGQYLRHVLANRDDLSATARHLLEVLGHVADADGMSWWSVGDLARRMGYVNDHDEPITRTVRRARRELVEDGLIIFTESRGRGYTNLYTVPYSGHWCPLCDAEKRTSGARNRTSGAGKPDTGVPPSIHRSVHKGPPVTIANGFALDANGSVDDFSTTWSGPPVDEIQRLIRERRYDEIPEP